MTSMTCSVVICAYSLDRWADLVEAVASLKRQTIGVPEIIVVIDHNEALRARADARLTDTRVVTNEFQRGLSGARNSGVAMATGEIVAFLDDDAVAAPDWLERLRARYDDPHVQGAGGAVIPRWAGGRRPRWFPPEFDWVVGCSYIGQPRTPAPVRNLIGANMSYRGQVLEEVGGFREGIGRIGRRPLGCEETELSIRVLNRYPSGLVIYDPEARVEHRVPRARQGPRYFLERCYAEGLSKALVSEWVGASSGLSTERTYTFRTLPRGVVRGIRDSLRGDLAGFARSVAIVTGLAVTTFGYLIGRIQIRRGGAASRDVPARPWPESGAA